jgi:hypothetical protein
MAGKWWEWCIGAGFGGVKGVKKWVFGARGCQRKRKKKSGVFGVFCG